jgi:glycosyltransferase involved in cell wall biosynthesis
MSSPDAPTVSIVIPAYNEASTIRACVVAAIEQTDPADEIVVVDNRSTDATLRILHDLTTEFPDAPLVVFSQDEEQGLVPTRDFGLDRALGEVLGRIDADTVLEPTWVHEVRRLFATRPWVRRPGR